MHIFLVFVIKTNTLNWLFDIYDTTLTHLLYDKLKVKNFKQICVYLGKNIQCTTVYKKWCNQYSHALRKVTFGINFCAQQI